MPGMPSQAPCSSGTASGSRTACFKGTAVYSAAVPKGRVRLRAIAPHAPPDPFPRDTFAHRINRARTVAVRNDTRIGHPDAKRILTLLDIARIYA